MLCRVQAAGRDSDTAGTISQLPESRQRASVMHLRPASWPLVAVGLMGIGIGVVGLLIHFMSDASGTAYTPLISGGIAAIGVGAILFGWFHDPSD